ncbi:hypothetical protein ACQ4PT_069686 [Festuca glaucescens]
MVPSPCCGVTRLKRGVCEYRKKRGKQYFKCSRSNSEFSPCMFFILRDSYVEYPRSCGITTSEQFTNDEDQVRPALRADSIWGQHVSALSASSDQRGDCQDERGASGDESGLCWGMHCHTDDKDGNPAVRMTYAA